MIHVNFICPFYLQFRSALEKGEKIIWNSPDQNTYNTHKTLNIHNITNLLKNKTYSGKSSQVHQNHWTIYQNIPPASLLKMYKKILISLALEEAVVPRVQRIESNFHFPWFTLVTISLTVFYDLAHVQVHSVQFWSTK